MSRIHCAHPSLLIFQVLSMNDKEGVSESVSARGTRFPGSY